MPTKQVIVIRKDLKMRRGKEIAQGNHASMAFLLHRIMETQPYQNDRTGRLQVENAVYFEAPESEWIRGDRTKVTLQVDSEEQLWEVFGQAQRAGLEVHMITDKGATEFHGVPTNTCLAIGPDYAEKIDPITAGLKLY
jgi:PTH2 family peptidyl-tRNA hydrolase